MSKLSSSSSPVEDVPLRRISRNKSSDILLSEFKDKFDEEATQTSVQLDHILQNQVKDSVMIQISAEKSDGYESDDGEIDESKSGRKVCCRYAMSSLFDLSLLVIGCGILVAGLAMWPGQSEGVNTQEKYQAAVLFAVSGLFLYPVLAKVFIGIFLHAYEGLLQWKRFAALSGVQEIHLYLTMVFYQIVRFVYILLDLITFAILEAICPLQLMRSYVLIFRSVLCKLSEMPSISSSGYLLYLPSGLHFEYSVKV